MSVTRLPNPRRYLTICDKCGDVESTISRRRAFRAMCTSPLRFEGTSASSRPSGAIEAIARSGSPAEVETSLGDRRTYVPFRYVSAKETLKEGIRHMEDCLKIEILTRTSTDPQVAGSYLELGKAYHNARDCDKALRLYSRALNIFQAMAAERGEKESLAMATCYSLIGLVHKDAERPEVAHEWLEKAMRVMNALQPDPFFVPLAEVANTLGSLALEEGKTELALECFDKALAVMLHHTVTPEESPHITLAYYNLALALITSSASSHCADAVAEAKTAEVALRRALRGAQKTFGDAHKVTTEIQLTLDKLTLELNATSVGTVAFSPISGLSAAQEMTTSPGDRDPLISPERATSDVGLGASR